jgi:hypothetical protein
MTLLTVDEARAHVVTSARRLVERCTTDDPFTISALLWGAGAVEDLDVRDRRLAGRHRQVLDDLNALGYGDVATEELDGISSALGLDEDRFDAQVWTVSRTRRRASRA